MRKYSLLSKFLLLIVAMLSTMPMASCSSVQTFDQFEQFCIVQSTENKDNEKWAHYLYTHLSQRTDLPELLTEKYTKDSHKLIVKVNLKPSLGNSYRIDLMENEMELSAGNKDIMLWLCYQFISKVAEQDARFNASDLPPAAIEMQNMVSEFPFEFRGIYSPSNANEDMLGITASHHVDYNWALWGHNLWKILGDNPNPDVYAKVNGNIDDKQYCFSSDALYKAIEKYILEQWGAGEKGNPARFTIMPMDNHTVCTCPKCKAAGNTENNATPAVTNMIVRLAKRFPNQMFFTSAYATTAKRPTRALPSNAGVLISAMDIPMVYDFRSTKAFADFDAEIKAWKKLAPQVYIWDYSRNFDDYLSPYPCLSIMQQRILYYKELGVKGIFINGSGEDYSTFDDIQTATLQALLVNPELDVNEYIKHAITRFYPKSADLLLPYYCNLEKKITDENIELSYYGGIDETLKFLNATELENMRTSLDKRTKTIQGDERTKLNKLLTGLSYTTLETMRFNDTPPSLSKGLPLLEILQGHESFTDMSNYKEALGKLETYIEQWNDDSQASPEDNTLKGQALKVVNLSDEETAKLTNGILGFYSDYHIHWVISKEEWQVTIPATEATSLRLSLLNAPAWRIWLPQQIEIKQAGETVATWSTPGIATDKAITERQFIDINISNADHSKPLTLHMTPVKQDRASIACDEIMTF